MQDIELELHKTNLVDRIEYIQGLIDSPKWTNYLYQEYLELIAELNDLEDSVDTLDT